jgi:hypothetical protein
VRRLHRSFRAGGVLIGTHAFVALSIVLEVRWKHVPATLDVDFALVGRNMSVALPPDLRIDVHNALESLEKDCCRLPCSTGKRMRNAVTPQTRKSGSIS